MVAWNAGIDGNCVLCKQQLETRNWWMYLWVTVTQMSGWMSYSSYSNRTSIAPEVSLFVMFSKPQSTWFGVKETVEDMVRGPDLMKLSSPWSHETGQEQNYVHSSTRHETWSYFPTQDIWIVFKYSYQLNNVITCSVYILINVISHNILYFHCSEPMYNFIFWFKMNKNWRATWSIDGFLLIKQYL